MIILFFFNYVIPSFCFQTLRGHLTHNSLSSLELVEKFFERKITEQVRQTPRNKLENLLWEHLTARFSPKLYFLPVCLHGRKCTVERNTVQSPSSRPTGGQTKDSELRCWTQWTSYRWTRMVRPWGISSATFTQLLVETKFPDVWCFQVWVTHLCSSVWSHTTFSQRLNLGAHRSRAVTSTRSLTKPLSCEYFTSQNHKLFPYSLSTDCCIFFP